MTVEDMVASSVRQFKPAREHIIVVAGALATVVQLACEIEHRTPGEHAALLVLAECLESSGVGKMDGLVAWVWESLGQLEVEQ